MNQRVEYIDTAKGLCMVLVVLFHVEIATDVHLPIDNYVQIMFMPLFYFLSGMFFKDYGNPKEFYRKKINSLLVPFLFFYTTTSLVIPKIMQLLINYDIKNPITWKSLWAFIYPEMFTNSPIWFLLSLFIVNILFYYINKFVQMYDLKHKPSVTIAVCFLCGILGYCFYYLGINLPSYIDSSLTALPFFCLGYVINRYSSWLNYNKKCDRYNWFILMILVVFTYFGAYDTASYIHNTYNVDVFSLYIFGFSGLSSLVLFCKLIHNIPLVSYWGRYSLIILVFHQPLIKIYLGILKSIGIGGGNLLFFVTLISLMFSFLIIIPISIRVLPHVLAQKEVIKNNL